MAEKKAEKKPNIAIEDIDEMVKKSMKKSSEERDRDPPQKNYTPDDGIPFPQSDDGIIDKD